MIPKLSASIAKKIIENNKLCDNSQSEIDRQEIVAYGIECLITSGIPIVIYVFYSIILGLFLPSLIWFCFFIVSRNYLGGYHASSNLRCILISSVYGIVCITSIRPFADIRLSVFTTLLIGFLIINFFVKPISSRPENQTNKYIKKLLAFSSWIVLISIISITLLHRISSLFSSAIFIGITSSEILFLIGKILSLPIKKRHED